MPLVFMYGPDTLQGRMFDRVGATDARGPAVLHGYRLTFDKPNMKNKQEGLPNIEEVDAGEVFGVVFELKDQQFAMLDGFFGGYEQRRVRPHIMPSPGDGDTEEDPTPVTACTWVARRTGRNLRPSHVNMVSTYQGLEQNGAAERFMSALEEFTPLPSETTELMVQFARGIPEGDARTILEAAGGTIRRRMRTDHDDQVQLLVQLPDRKAEDVERQLKLLPQVTLVERNSDGYSILPS